MTKAQIFLDNLAQERDKEEQLKSLAKIAHSHAFDSINLQIHKLDWTYTQSAILTNCLKDVIYAFRSEGFEGIQDTLFEAEELGMEIEKRIIAYDEDKPNKHVLKSKLNGTRTFEDAIDTCIAALWELAEKMEQLKSQLKQKVEETKLRHVLAVIDAQHNNN